LDTASSSIVDLANEALYDLNGYLIVAVLAGVVLCPLFSRLGSKLPFFSSREGNSFREGVFVHIYNRFDLLLALLIFTLIFVGLHFRLPENYQGFLAFSSEKRELWGVLAQLVLFLSFFAIFFRTIHLAFSSSVNLNLIYGLRVTKWRSFLKTCFLGLGLAYLCAISGQYIFQSSFPGLAEKIGAQEVVDNFRSKGNFHSKLLIGLSAVVIAPIVEEFIFRGYLYPVLKKYTQKYYAAIVTSILFAIVHFHLPTLVPLALLGIALCFVYERSGTLWAPICVHALFNATSLLGMLFLAK